LKKNERKLLTVILAAVCRKTTKIVAFKRRIQVWVHIVPNDN